MYYYLCWIYVYKKRRCRAWRHIMTVEISHAQSLQCPQPKTPLFSLCYSPFAQICVNVSRDIYLWVVQQVIAISQHDCKLTNKLAQQCTCADWGINVLAIILYCETQLPVATDRVAWLPWAQKRELAVVLFAPAFGLAKFLRPLVVGEIHHILDFLLIFDLWDKVQIWFQYCALNVYLIHTSQYLCIWSETDLKDFFSPQNNHSHYNSF